VDKHPLGLYEPQERIGWEVDAPEGSGEVLVRVQAPDAKEETVLWITPNTARQAAVLVESAGTRWELDRARFRQTWAGAAAVQLAGGRWLECRPVDGADGHAEIVLRSTASGLLIGCVAAAGAECAWRLAVRDQPSI
jgi:hypothetical protein